MKQEFIQSLFDGIPVELSGMLGTKFGSFEAIQKPTTEGGAIIAMGVFCAEVQNNILVPLSGFPLVDALLYIGSLNPPTIAGLFAGLETVTASSGPFDVIAPKDGGIYPGFFDGWIVRAADEESINVLIGEDNFEMDRNDDLWTAKWPIAIGRHTATIVGGSQSVTVTFSVVSYTILEPIVTPIDEETKQVEIRYELPEGSGAESGEITVSDGTSTWNVVLAVTGTICAGIVLFPVSATVATVAGIIGFATGAQLLINQHVLNVN